MHKHWFRRRKILGLGYTPISVEGWIITAILVGMIIIIAYTNNLGGVGMYRHGVALNQVLNFVWQFLVTLGLFCMIAESKTEHTLGEKITTALKRK